MAEAERGRMRGRRREDGGWRRREGGGRREVRGDGPEKGCERVEERDGGGDGQEN